MSRAMDEERDFEYAEERDAERVYRIRAARRLSKIAGFSSRIDPPEYEEDQESCIDCGVALDDGEGTTCEVCHWRICSLHAVVDTVKVTVAGHPATTLRFRCQTCLEGPCSRF